MRTFAALVGIRANRLSFMVMEFRNEKDQEKAYNCLNQMAKADKLPMDVEVIVSEEDHGLVLVAPPSADATAIFAAVRLELALELSLQASRSPCCPSILPWQKNFLPRPKNVVIPTSTKLCLLPGLSKRQFREF